MVVGLFGVEYRGALGSGSQYRGALGSGVEYRGETQRRARRLSPGARPCGGPALVKQGVSEV